MTDDGVRVRIIDDVPANGDAPAFAKGSELLVPSTVAAALVLCGAAIELAIG